MAGSKGPRNRDNDDRDGFDHLAAIRRMRDRKRICAPGARVEVYPTWFATVILTTDSDCPDDVPTIDSTDIPASVAASLGSEAVGRLTQSLEQLLSCESMAGRSGVELTAELLQIQDLQSFLSAAAAKRIAALTVPGIAGDPTALVERRMTENPMIASLTPQQQQVVRAGETVLVAEQLAVAQVGSSLTITPAAASRRVQEAVELVEQLPLTVIALEEGCIDQQRARILATRSRVLRGELRAELESRLLPQASSCTPRQWQNLVDAEVLVLDPDAAEQRRKDAVERRRLRVERLEDGIGRFMAELPAHQAQLAWDLFDAVAQALKGVDERTVDQRRADAFVTIVEMLASGQSVSVADILGHPHLTRHDSCYRPEHPDDLARAQSTCAGGASSEGTSRATEKPQGSDDRDPGHAGSDPASDEAVAGLGNARFSATNSTASDTSAAAESTGTGETVDRGGTTEPANHGSCPASESDGPTESAEAADAGASCETGEMAGPVATPETACVGGNAEAGERPVPGDGAGSAGSAEVADAGPPCEADEMAGPVKTSESAGVAVNPETGASPVPGGTGEGAGSVEFAEVPKVAHAAEPAGVAGIAEPADLDGDSSVAEPAKAPGAPVSAGTAETVDPTAVREAGNAAGSAGSTEVPKPPEAIATGVGAESGDPTVLDETAGPDDSGPDDSPNAPDSSTDGCRCGRWHLPAKQGRATHATVVITVEALAGLSQDPATLSGHGVVTAEYARTLAAAAQSVNFLVVDDGRPLAIGDRTAYRPRLKLRDRVATAYPTCIFTGCHRPVADSQLDHRDPWNSADPDSGGATDLENLQPLCAHHHRLKTHAGWTYRPGDSGAIALPGRRGRPATPAAFVFRSPIGVESVSRVDHLIRPRHEMPPPF